MLLKSDYFGKSFRKQYASMSHYVKCTSVANVSLYISNIIISIAVMWLSKPMAITNIKDINIF